MTRRFVVIEDDKDLGALMAAKLERTFDGKTSAFVQGLAALTYLEKEPAPDLICCDLALPDISGFEVCSRVRRIEHLQRVPLVVISGRTGVDDYARAVEVGATAFVEKPFNMKVLLERVKNLLDDA